MESTQRVRKTKSPKAAANFSEYLPKRLRQFDDPQKALPKLAKNKKNIAEIENTLLEIPTTHALHLRDSRDRWRIKPDSVHLVVTSPPYWTLKKYRDCDGQLGDVEDYELFLRELDKVWKLKSKAC